MDRVSFTLEFLFRASPAIIYKFLTTPSALIRWFCDEVDIERDVDGDIYTFSWEGAEEVAQLIDDIEEERVRFQWEDGEEGEYLEFRMSRSPVTGETILEITDFCDDDEVDDQKQLWDTQVSQMKIATGG